MGPNARRGAARRALAALALLAGSGLGALAAAAEPPKIDMAALVRDTQRQAPDPRHIGLVWWIPIEYWTAALGQGGQATPQQIQEVKRVLSPYTVIAAVDGKVGPLGGATFVDEPTLRKAIALVDAQDRRYTPLADAELSPDARALQATLKPIIQSIMGALGENLQFFFFKAKGADGAAIADATAEGSFSVKLGEETHRWRLPLGSLLPPKQCPVDGESLSGAWKYCPWHGKALRAKSADAPAPEAPAAAQP